MTAPAASPTATSAHSHRRRRPRDRSIGRPTGPAPGDPTIPAASSCPDTPTTALRPAVPIIHFRRAPLTRDIPPALPQGDVAQALAKSVRAAARWRYAGFTPTPLA